MPRVNQPLTQREVKLMIEFANFLLQLEPRRLAVYDGDWAYFLQVRQQKRELA